MAIIRHLAWKEREKKERAQTGIWELDIRTAFYYVMLEFELRENSM